MNYAKIKDGVVSHILKAEAAYADGQGWLPATGAKIGDLWDGSKFSTPPAPAPTKEAVNAERDRRVRGGFSFGGVLYQSRDQDMENIAGTASAALGAIMFGAQPDDLRWADPNKDFAWIAADNSLTLMDAQTAFSFGQAAMAHKQALIFAARVIKNGDPVIADFAEQEHWT